MWAGRDISGHLGAAAADLGVAIPTLRWLEAFLEIPLLLLALIACTTGKDPPDDPQDTGGFAVVEEVAPRLVPTFALAPGLEIEGLGRAITLGDLDGDGRMDLLSGTALPSGPAESTVNLHLAQEDGSYTLVTEEWGIVRANPSWGLVAVERLGRTDVLITASAWDGADTNQWLRPSPAGSTFEDLESGPCGEGATMGAAVADFDLDGDLDIALANGTALDNGGCMELLLQDDGVFVSSPDVGEGTHEGFGAVAADLTGDLYPELGVGVGAGGILYHNLGAPPYFAFDDPQQQRFDRVREVEEDIDWTMATLSTLMLDYDQDGDLDWFLCTWESPQIDAGAYQRLYRNDGGGVFVDVSEETGVAGILGCMGAGTGDIDLNGWPDLYLGTGGPNEGDAWPNALLMNEGGVFVDMAAEAGVEWTGRTHGIAFADMDDDGRMDLVASSGGAEVGQEEGLRIALSRGDSYSGIPVTLEGPGGNPTAVGAQLLAVTNKGERHVWHIRGEGFASSVLGPTWIGLGEATQARVLARFPDGRVAQTGTLSAPFGAVTLRWEDAE